MIRSRGCVDLRHVSVLVEVSPAQGTVNDRNCLLTSALEKLPDGVAVFDSMGHLVFWNPAAEAITGYAFAELESCVLPRGLTQLQQEVSTNTRPRPDSDSHLNRGMHVRTRHKMGHEVPVVRRNLPLYDSEGQTIGAAVFFHPAERLEAPPRFDGNDESSGASQAEFQERLSADFEDFVNGGPQLGILWVAVDQRHKLRKTHGAAACHAMLEKVHHALASGLRPTEELSCWGEDDFLIVTHEEILERRAGALAALARAADFRWWGDRIALTVSVGAVQAHRRGSLHKLLQFARESMETSMRAGGNHVTYAQIGICEEESDGEELICTPS